MSLDRSIARAGLSGLSSAREWNKFAQDINTLWNTKAGPGLKLTKGEPWLLESFDEIPIGDKDFEPINGAVYQIYVFRPTAVGDWQINEPPESFFITGPFTTIHSESTQHIAKLIAKPGGGTTVERPFADVCGFQMADGFTYYQQRMSKSGDSLLVAGGLGLLDLAGDPGLFFGVNKTSGTTLFAPYDDINALLPGIVDEEVMGVASYGDTIALATGFLGTVQVGITLYDTDGNPVIADAGFSSYLWNHETLDGTYWSLMAGVDGYYFAVPAQDSGTEYPPGLRKVQATAAGGIVADAAWDAEAGSGGSTLRPGVLRQDNLFGAFTLDGWNGTAATTSISFLSNLGTTFITGIVGMPDIAMMPFCYGGVQTLNAIGEVQQWIVFGQNVDVIGSNPNILYLLRLNYSPTTLTILTGFDGYVSDCKFFRRKNNNLTDQFIVVGGFTTYQGFPAVGMVFIDQFGNRLADLEWP